VLRSDIRPPLRGAAAAAGEALIFRHAGVSGTPVLVNSAAGSSKSTSWPIPRASVALAQAV